MLSRLSKMNFIAKGINLPMNWADMGAQFPDAFTEAERMAPPPSPMNLFREPTFNKYHVDSARRIGVMFEDYIDGICGAICEAIGKWMKMASVAGLTINGPVGNILPGGVIGPPLAPLIMAHAPREKKQNLKYSTAIANAIDVQWQKWHMGLTGALMYPSFAVFPGPMAPPMPNAPIPLIALSSSGESGLSPGALKNRMEENFGAFWAFHSSNLFDAIAKAFNSIFQIFKASTILTNVLGTGPVPSFAPPASPVGPVVAGFSVPTPGVFK